MDLMIDLETLGTDPDCPVIAIGAVFFDESGLKDEFYEVLNVEEQIDGGRRVTGSTIKWWMSQSDAAKRVFKDGARETMDALDRFVTFCKRYPQKGLKPWGNGSTFDISIMDDLFKDADIPSPWLYYNVRDLRTFKEDVYDGKDLPREGTHHNALDDAKHQARIVIEGRRRIKNLKEGK